MIQISNLKLQIPHTTKRLKEKALKQLHIREQDLIGFRIAKRSLDARKKPVLYYVYTLELSVKNEAGLQKKNLPKNVNVCKTKHLTNTRSSNADEALRLTPPRILSLEEALDFIDTDELLEVTPETLRIRKKILDSRMRKRSNLK